MIKLPNKFVNSKFLLNTFLQILLIFVITLIPFTLGTKVSAQTQDPNDFPNIRNDHYVPCDQTSDTTTFFNLITIWKNLDFHPLRPYPGSPCDRLIPKSKPENQPISFQCGKSLGVKDLETFNPYGEDTDCKIENGQAICARREDFDVAVDFKGARLPILGNSENLSLTDGQKVNNYLDWYLAGSARNWLEDTAYPYIRGDMDRLVNYSGPIRKLLPFDQQLRIRSLIIDPREPANGLKTAYHNYLAGCTLGTFLNNYWTKVGERFERTADPNDPMLQQILEYVKNLDKLPRIIYDSFTGQTVNCDKTVAGWFDGKIRLDDYNGIFPKLVNWFNSLPPDPKDYDKFGDYWKKYIEWTGSKPIPFIGPVNLPIPFYLPDYWALLFQNIQFSTLEDTPSEFTVSVFDDPRTSKQDPQIITQDLDKPWGKSQAKADADRLGLPYDQFPPGDTAYFKSQPHLVNLTIKRINKDGSLSDSRTFLPHLKAARALTDLLQSTYRPSPGKFDETLIAGKVTEHQGINDDTPVINKVDNNSSVRPGYQAPEALFGHTPNISPDKFSYDTHCELTEVRSNPGDDILGGKVTANLRYTQVFRFTPKVPIGPVPDGGQCYAELNNDGQPTNNANAQCKSGICENIEIPNPSPNCNKLCTTSDECGDGLICVDVNYLTQEGRCRNPSGPLSDKCYPQKVYGSCHVNPPVELPVNGFAAVFTKLPYGEELYQKLVAGPDSVFRRFMFKFDPTEIKKIPAVSTVAYEAFNNKTGGQSQVLAGNGNGSPEVYWDGLGSILDYVLGASLADKNLQRLLRPRDFSTGSVGFPDNGSPTQSAQCTTLASTIDFRNTSAPVKSKQDVINAIKTQFPGNQVEQYYDTLIQKAKDRGYNPAFVLAIWIEESGASAYSQFGTDIADFGCVRATHGNFDAQLNCFLNLFDFYSSGSSANSLFEPCRQGGDTPNFEDFMLFYSEGICSTVQSQNRTFCANPQFPGRIQRYYNLVSP